MSFATHREHFNNVEFRGHTGRNDFSYGKIPAEQLGIVKSVVASLGWKIQRTGIRPEYNGYDVIVAPSVGMLEEIPGYRPRQNRIDYMILRTHKDEIHMTFSGWGMVTPFTEENFDKLISAMRAADITVQLPFDVPIDEPIDESIEEPEDGPDDEPNDESIEECIEECDE